MLPHTTKNFRFNRSFLYGSLLVVISLIIIGVCFWQFAPVHKQTLLIRNQYDESYHFKIEIADTKEERQKGLMFRESIPEDYGMLFLFEEPIVVNMWMKNTLIPLDMVFIDEKGVIVNIIENTVPHSLLPLSSEQKVIAVLEVKAGTVQNLSFQKGDEVFYHYFRQ